MFCDIKNESDNPIVRNTRKNGIGKSMINAIQKRYKMKIKAETDDDAVEFYRKCGFETETFMKTYNTGEYQRYKCILHTV